MPLTRQSPHQQLPGQGLAHLIQGLYHLIRRHGTLHPSQGQICGQQGVDRRRNAEGPELDVIQGQFFLGQGCRQDLVQDRAFWADDPLALQVCRRFEGRILNHDVEGFRRPAVDADHFHVGPVGRGQDGARAAEAAGDIQASRSQGFRLFGSRRDDWEGHLRAVFFKSLDRRFVELVHDAGDVQGRFDIGNAQFLDRRRLGGFGFLAAAARQDCRQGKEAEEKEGEFFHKGSFQNDLGWGGLLRDSSL